MQWDHEKCLQLIDLYKEKTELWNPNDNNYHIKTKKHDAWMYIAENMNCDVDVARQKMTSLLSSFRREKQKVKKTTGTGKGKYLLTSFTVMIDLHFLIFVHRTCRSVH